MSIDDAFAEHARVIEASRALVPTAREIAARMTAALREGKKLLVCGNGGSAADAQHFTAELVGRFVKQRRALPAIALTTDTSAITALANDDGFEVVFARQIEALAQPGDVVVGISTSGRSPNVLAAMKAARAKGCTCVALTRAGGVALADAADLTLAVPADDTARIQEVHELCLHAIAREIEESLFP